MDADPDTPVCRLQTPIQLDSLLQNNAVEFSIRDDEVPGDKEEDTNLAEVYKYEDIEPHFFMDGDSSDESETDSVAGSGNESSLTNDSGIGNDEVEDISFPCLRKKMFNLRPDGKVMKMILRTGTSEPMPEDDGTNWVVYVHYSAYAEYEGMPFDCTYLRQKKPVKMRLDDTILAGVEIAIRSMRKGEMSRFLIHPDLAFREHGAPPRIPGNATVMFKIELFDYARVTEKTTNSNEPPPPETCQETVAKARRLCERGTKRKKQEKNVNGAISQYRKGVVLLMEYNAANAEEEQLIQNELIKLYTNLAVCYLQKEDYRRVCISYNDAVHDCKAKVDTSVKLNYVSAKALRLLGNFSEAKNRIRKAARLKPGNEDILKELNELENTIEKTRKDEKDRARKMMGFNIERQNENGGSDTIDTLLDVVDPQFKETFLEVLTEFLNNPDVDNMRMPGEFNQAEIKYCQRVCAEKKIGIKMLGSAADGRMVLVKRALLT